MLNVYVLLSVGIIVLVHLGISKLKFLQGTPRSRWLSFTGGVSAAYVFVNLIPELVMGQEEIGMAGGIFGSMDKVLYVIAMLGVVLFYVIERIIQTANSGESMPFIDRRRAFALQSAFFALYSFTIGYAVLPREADDLVNLSLLTATLALHFVGNDYGLRDDFKELYDRYERYIISAALVAGLLLSVIITLEIALDYVFIAFLAGGIILNVLKEELPVARKARITPFFIGGLVFALLLLLV